MASFKIYPQAAIILIIIWAGGLCAGATWMICEGRDYPRLRWEGVECGPER